jgi:hypothetical protein
MDSRVAVGPRDVDGSRTHAQPGCSRRPDRPERRRSSDGSWRNRTTRRHHTIVRPPVLQTGVWSSSRRSVPARSRTWCLDLRRVACSFRHTPRTIHYLGLDSNQDLDLRRVRCCPLHHRDVQSRRRGSHPHEPRYEGGALLQSCHVGVVRRRPGGRTRQATVMSRGRTLVRLQIVRGIDRGRTGTVAVTGRRARRYTTIPVRRSSPGGIRTHSIPDSESRWSAGSCLPSREATTTDAGHVRTCARRQ